MIPVFLTDSFRDDLEEIWNFLGRDNPEVADRVTLELIDRALEISSAPKAAAVVPQFAHLQVRRVMVRRWVILYRADDERVIVLRVIHGGRHLESLSLAAE